MAVKVFLGANDTFTASNNNLQVVGASGGTEKLLIASGVTGVTTDANVERIELAGAQSAYKFLIVAGTGIVISDATTGLVVATIPSLNQAATIAFTDGSAVLTQTGGAAATLGSVSLTSTATVTTATLNAADVSTAPGATPVTVTPTFSVAASAASVVEGNNATFTVTLSAAQAAATTVVYTLAGTGAATLGTDTGTHVPAGNSGTLTFAAGEVTKTITVPVTIDATVETGEGVSLTLSAPSTGTAVAATPSATVTFTDAPAPTFAVTSNGSTMRTEGNSVTFSVTPSSAVLADTSMTYTINGDTLSGVATAAVGADFSKASGAITFTKGQTAASTVTIDLKSGDGAESLEGYKFIVLDSALASVGSVTGQIIDADAATSSGQVFTLTTGADTSGVLLGSGGTTSTSGDDTFNGSLVYASGGTTVDATSTLTVADQINGGALADVLNVTITGGNAGTTFQVATITGIETLNLRNVSGQDNTVAVSNIAGLTAINADRATSDVLLTGVATGASVGMLGDGTAANGTLKYAYTTASTAQTINISGGTSNSATANITATASTGVTTATINSTGAANKVDTILLDSATNNTVTSLTVNAATDLTATLTATDFAATAALTVSGAAASVDLGSTFDGKTIDASGLTVGGLTIATNANTTSFKGGQGNDTVTATAIAVTTAGAVDAGAGTADVLQVTDSTVADSAAETALFTNFEVLRNAHNTDIDVSLFSGITSVQTGSANAGATKMTAAQAANIVVLASNGTNTFSLTTATGSTDVLGLMAVNATAAAVATPIDITAATVTGFETLNIVSSSGVKAGGTGTGNDLAFAAAGDLTAINVSGAYDLTIATANITKAATITSTQSGTAALYVSGDLAVGSTVTGSGGADAFIFGTVGTTYNGGAGDDTMSATQAQINTGAVYSAANGGDGTDTLNLTGAGAITIVDNVLSKITGFEKISITDTTTNNQSITTGGWFDAAFKTNGVNLTTTTTTGTVTIDMTSFTGAATLSVTTVGTAGAEGVVSVQTGSGADKVTVVDAAASNAGTISTFGGNDTIIGGVNDETITGGTGTDTMTGGITTANTFVFAAGDSGGVPSATAFDTITDFTAVAANVINAGAASIVTNATATSGVAAVSAAGVATFHAADTTFALHLIAVEAAINAGGVAAAGQSAMWQEGSDAYLFVSDGVDGLGANDLLVKLVGLDTTAGAFDTLTDGGTTFTIA